MRPLIQAKGIQTTMPAKIPTQSVHDCSFQKARVPGRSVDNTGHTHSTTAKSTAVPATTPANDRLGEELPLSGCFHIRIGH
jgi:hypothetical protein